MSLSPGTATNGFTGAIAIQSTDTGGSLRYIPCYNIDPQVYDGQEPVMLINNTAFPVNVVRGTSYAVITLTCPLIALLHNADFFARAVLSGVGDTGASGYHTMTVWADNLGGDTPKVYGRCKFASMRLRSTFSQQAGQQITFLDFTIWSADPESTTVTAAAAPPAGALSVGGILGFGQSVFTGASSVVGTELTINTGIQFIPGVTQGNNANYPVLPNGIMLNTIGGTVRLTQIRNPATALVNGPLITAFGTTGAGVSFAQQLRRMMNSKRQAGGINYVTNSYFLNSLSGASPLVVSDL